MAERLEARPSWPQDRTDFVIQRRSNDTVACNGFSETACFLYEAVLFEGCVRRLGPRHLRRRVGEGHSPCEGRPAGTLIHRCRQVSITEHTIGLTGERIHLAIEGRRGTSSPSRCGRCHRGRATRVWASVDMIQHGFLALSAPLTRGKLPLHANFGGVLIAVDAAEAANSLPSVGLVVMDDWCPASGRIPSDRLDHIQRGR